MSKSLELSEDDRQRLAALKNQNQQKGRDRNQTIDCKSIRNAFSRGNTVGYLAEEHDRRRETIRKHLTGECSCSNNAPTLETIGEKWVREAVCPHEGCSRSYKAYEKLSEHINFDH